MTRPMLTQREAAAACGVSRTTIRRRREAGERPGSFQDPEHGWMVPVDDLLAAGFRLNAPTPADQAAPAPAGPAAPSAGESQDAAALRAELARMNAEHALALAEARYGQKLAEAEAEHLRRELVARGEHIADFQRAVAALTPAPARPALNPPGGHGVPGQTQADPGESESGLRKRWLVGSSPDAVGGGRRLSSGPAAMCRVMPWCPVGFPARSGGSRRPACPRPPSGCRLRRSASLSARP